MLSSIKELREMTDLSEINKLLETRDWMLVSEKDGKFTIGRTDWRSSGAEARWEAHQKTKQGVCNS